MQSTFTKVKLTAGTFSCRMMYECAHNAFPAVQVFCPSPAGLQAKKFYQEAARKRQLDGLRQGNDSPVRLTSDEQEKGDTLVKAAKQVGISKDAVWKASVIERDGIPEVTQEAKESKLTINKAFAWPGFSLLFNSDFLQSGIFDDVYHGRTFV
ncbi:MAG: hypothetical protein AB9903_12475 [Vulcanimicrobiota bacterium]